MELQTFNSTQFGELRTAEIEKKDLLLRQRRCQSVGLCKT